MAQVISTAILVIMRGLKFIVVTVISAAVLGCLLWVLVLRHGFIGEFHVVPGSWSGTSQWLSTELTREVATSSREEKKPFTKRVVLPSMKLIRCVKSDCLKLLEQNERPRAGDIYPDDITVAYLNHWCPIGVTATYSKSVPFECLQDALETLYGKGTRENWTDALLLTWKLQADEIYFSLISPTSTWQKCGT